MFVDESLILLAQNPNYIESGFDRSIPEGANSVVMFYAISFYSVN